MKVLTDTPDLLIVEDRPVLIAVLLIVFTLIFVGVGLALLMAGEWFGLLFALGGGGAGFVAFWGFVRRVQVVFHRPERYVEFRRRNMFNDSSVRHGLEEIERAEVEETYTSEGSHAYRVVLVVPQGQSAGRHPITVAYSSGTAHLRVAEAINSWLERAR